MLPRGAASEILAGHDDVPGIYPVYPTGFKAFKTILAKLPGITGYQEPGRNNGVRVDMITHFAGLSFILHKITFSTAK
jgi:hypothetical protein